jgi:hypothetical protein
MEMTDDIPNLATLIGVSTVKDKPITGIWNVCVGDCMEE